jgi:hypothetical protein
MILFGIPIKLWREKVDLDPLSFIRPNPRSKMILLSVDSIYG